MNRAELKAAAKQQISGKIGVLFLISLVIAVVGGLVGVIPVVGSLISAVVLTPAFALSLATIYLGVTRGEKPQVSDAFKCVSNFWPAFKVTFLTGLFVSLWSLLFVIPGIVKSFSYSMALYIQAENPGKPALECIAESKAMTEGHKMELFVLGLSFIGWALLCGITLGIASIWVIPYMEATMANAYYKLKSAVVEAENA